MKLSTTTLAAFRLFDYEDGIRMLAEVGFDALDMNFCDRMDREEFAPQNLEKTSKMLRDLAVANGVSFNQAHAPFPVYLFHTDKQRMAEYNTKIFPQVVDSIRSAGMLGADQIVVHPIACPDVSVQKQMNLDFYNKLIPYAEEYNIKIALENMWGVSQVNRQQIMANVCSFGRDLAEYYDALDPRYFTVCLDIGHCGLVGESADNAIRALGSRLHALHVHDTDHIHDLHTLPYMGKVDWDAVTKALAEVDYDGDFTFEVEGTYMAPYAEDRDLMRKAFELLELTGRKLISKIYTARG